MSSVFYPKSGFTAAVVFGCNKTLTDDIAGRMRAAENSTSHPLLMMGVVAEIERERHSKLVREQVFQLLGRVYALSKQEQISTTSTIQRDHYSIDSWIKISQLRSELQTWKAQLSRMVEHIDQLEDEVFKEQTSNPFKGSFGSYSDTIVEEDMSLDDEKTCLRRSASDEVNWKHHGRKTGRRIKRRLREISNDYDQSIRECTMVIDGLILATQMVCIEHVPKP